MSDLLSLAMLVLVAPFAVLVLAGVAKLLLRR